MFRVGKDEQTACLQFGRTQMLAVLQAEMGANQSIAQLLRYVADHPVVGGAQKAAEHLQATPGIYGGLATALSPYSTGQIAWMLFSASHAAAGDASLAAVLQATKLTGLWLPQRATLRMEGFIDRDVLVH